MKQSCVFSFSAKAKQGALFYDFPQELERGREKSPRSEKVAINTGREQFLSIFILHKHNPPASKTANRSMDRGPPDSCLSQMLRSVLGGVGEGNGASGLLR